MIVLWQLTVLHARKAGWLSPWLLHFSNVVGGVIIAFAWWGVNMLGVGLHSTASPPAVTPWTFSTGLKPSCASSSSFCITALRRVDIR